MRFVEAAWLSFEEVNLANIWVRWQLVLDLIIKDKDGDRLGKSRRGKLFCARAEEAEDLVTEIAEVAERVRPMSSPRPKWSCPANIR